jgi:hypothetical protein
MSAAGTLYQTTGYQYRQDPDYDWPQQYVHWSIAFVQRPTSKNQGACIACHMDGSPQKHLFTPFSTASNGVIAQVTSTTCFNTTGCHNTTNFTAGFLQSKKDGYQASLAVVTKLLEGMTIYFNPAKPPYFFDDQANTTPTTNWVRTINGTQYGSDVMGAAFNLRLLLAEAGAWAHNDIYTKRLLYDTVDFLDNGQLDNSVSVTIQNMSTIDQATKDNAQAYIGVRP